MGKPKARTFGTQVGSDLEESDARTTGTGTHTDVHADELGNCDAISLLSQLDTEEAEDDFFHEKLTSTQMPDSLTTLGKAGSVNLRGFDNVSTQQDDDFKLQRSESTSSQLKDQPSKGFAYYIAHTITMSGNLYAQQLLFRSAPQMAIMQLTFLRGAVCSLMMLALINRNIKSTLIDPVDRTNVGSVIFRCLQGGISVYIGFMCLNFFTVSTVGVVCSLKPIIACIIGVVCLGETMGCRDIVSMAAILGAVFLVIFGSTGSQSDAVQANIGALIALIAQPVLLASGDTMLRKLRKMPEQLCSTYQNLMLMSLAAIYMAATGLSFDFVYTLSGKAWLFIVLSCALTILGSITKALAFKYSESAKLQKLSFLPNVWQFLIDLIVMSVAFSAMQLTGFSLLISFYVLECSWGLISERLRKKEFVASDDGYNTV